jgi:hypothetical protein
MPAIKAAQCGHDFTIQSKTIVNIACLPILIHCNISKVFPVQHVQHLGYSSPDFCVGHGEMQGHQSIPNKPFLVVVLMLVMPCVTFSL